MKCFITILYISNNRILSCNTFWFPNPIILKRICLKANTGIVTNNANTVINQIFKFLIDYSIK